MLFGAVIRDTPVRWGTLRANWIATENSPSSETIENPGATSGEPPAGGNMTPPEFEPTVRLVRLKNNVHLTNNLPYAIPIERSRGMVKRNILRWTTIVRNAAERNG